MAYAFDDRAGRGTDPPMVAYVYAADHKTERPETHLQGFAGILQVDGYVPMRRLPSVISRSASQPAIAS